MKDWNLIISEYRKSELLKDNDENNLSWFLSKDEWLDFSKYIQIVGPYDISENKTIIFMGVKFFKVKCK